MASVIVFGATGLVGEAVLSELSVANEVTSIISYGRRQPLHQCLKMRNIRGEYQDLRADLSDVSAEHCFIALGTTIRKAGSQAAFRDVDYRMVLDAARWASQAGVKSVAVVSSVGADPNAFAFYPRVKGEVEEELKGLNIPRLLIFRPGLLLGDRREFRFGETLATPLMKVVNFALVGRGARYRAISAQDVAKAMVKQSLGLVSGAQTSTVIEGLDFYR